MQTVLVMHPIYPLQLENLLVFQLEKKITDDGFELLSVSRNTFLKSFEFLSSKDFLKRINEIFDTLARMFSKNLADFKNWCFQRSFSEVVRQNYEEFRYKLTFISKIHNVSLEMFHHRYPGFTS